jgi:hypothetical protein
VVTGQPAEAGILDYDLAYFGDSDLSWEAEDTVIRAGGTVFSGLSAPGADPQSGPRSPVVRAEVRVAVPAAPLNGGGDRHVRGGRRMPRCPAGAGRRWRVYAPFGLSDAFNLVVRPDPVLAPRHVYQAKTGRWRRQWPGLTVLPWP